MTDVCKPVLSKLQITGGWRVKCKLFVKFASSKKREVKNDKVICRQFNTGITFLLLLFSAFTVKAVCKQMRQPLRKGGINHTGDPDMSHDFHMYSGSYMHSKQSKGLSDHN